MPTKKTKEIFVLIFIFTSVHVDYSQSRTLGNKSYEVSNHLGNVMAVVSDRKTPTPETTNTIIAFNETDIKSFNDYYPYGMLLENRNGSNNYRFGFHAQEKDDEVKGNNATTIYTNRVYDNRVAKWYSMDFEYQSSPYSSPYVAFENNPIYYKDLEGNSIAGWSTVLTESNYKYAQLLLKQSKTFNKIIKSYSYGHKNYNTTLLFKIDNTISERGLTSLDYQLDENGNIIKDSFKITVSLREEGLEEGEKIVTLAHEVGLHVDSYQNLINQYKKGKLSQEEFLHQASEINDSDHKDVHDEKTDKLDLIFDEVHNLESGNTKSGWYKVYNAQNKNGLVPTGLRLNRSNLATYLLTSFYTDYLKYGIDLSRNKSFNDNLGNHISVETNFNYHRIKHNSMFDENGEVKTED